MGDVPRMVPPAGTRVVVAGGCGGIGSALVKACVALDHRVAVIDLPRSIEQCALPEGVTAIGVDATESAQIDAGLAEATRVLGGIDLLVNLIGFVGRMAPIDELTDDEWNGIMRGNLDSFTTLARRALPILKQSGSAAIVNVASGMGVRPLAGGSAYSVAKAGVISLTKVLALECAPSVRTNAVAPGIVRTAFLTGGTGRDLASPNGNEVDTETYLKSVPMRRLGEVDDIVGPILFLASPAASFINGQTIHINGGGLLP